MIVNDILTIMDRIDGMKTVIAVVETGSFTAAAERLGISKALVSKYIGQMEQQLQVRLFNRSTRRMSLTENGQWYYEQALQCLEQFAALEEGIQSQQHDAKGLLRVGLQTTFGESFVAPLLPQFLQQYPHIQIELCLSDQMVDMLKEGIDLVVRIGSVKDSQLIARKITSYPLRLCASPEYIKQHGSPETPAQLSEHQCIIDSNFRIGRNWPFTDAQNQRQQVSVNSRVAVNSPRGVLELALQGAGIALIPDFVASQALKDQQLIHLLDQYHIADFDVFALYPHRRFVPRKVQCFIDFLLQHFAT